MNAIRNTFLIASVMYLFAACSSEPKDETPEQKEQRVIEEAVQCDPLVGVLRDLMLEYEKELTKMIENGKVDANKLGDLSTKAKEVSDLIEERGEKTLGIKCWSEFKTIGKTYGPRIAKLGMQVAMLDGGMEAVDPEMLERLQKVMQ